MPQDAERVQHLAQLLSAHRHSRPVTARWDVDRDDPEGGYWTLTWTDGPDWDTLHRWARDLVTATPALGGLDLLGTSIWGRRVDSPAAWASLLITEAIPHSWRTPRTWRGAQQLLDHAADVIDDRCWLDEVEDPGERVAVAGLVNTSGGNRLRMARLVLAEWRGLPKATSDWDQVSRPTGRCHACGALFLVKSGPQRRWCGPRCRLRHWRTAQAAEVLLTESGDDPACVACGQPIPLAGGRGRPARYCCPACRQFVHHHRDATPDHRQVVYAHRRDHPPTVPAQPERAAVDAVPADPVPVWAAAPTPRPAKPRTPLRPELAGCLGGSRTVHQLRLEVDDIDPPIWRRVVVPSGMRLVDLSAVLCTALGWSDEHLHAFSGVPGADGHCGTNPAEFRLTVADLLKDVGWATTYTYDFGDWWHVSVAVEKVITRPSATTFYPRCVAGRRNGPAEDCGGVPGYEQLLKALRARKGWHYREVRERWPRWKPETFDLADVNRELERWYVDTRRGG